MVKADAKVVYEKNKPEKYTNFELLQKEVEVLQDTVENLVKILRANNTHRTKRIEAEYFDYDKVFRELEE